MLTRAIFAAALLAVSGVSEARAQSTIRRPGERSNYHVELEPHLLAGLFSPPGDGAGSGWGGGVRASFEIVPRGFVSTINDSVAIGVGLDIVHYDGGSVIYPGRCTRFAAGPGATMVCVEVSQRGGPSNYVYFPVVLQWNFWLTRQWSVFAEPGLAVYDYDGRDAGASPVLYVGGRYQFSDKVTLTMRLGFPTLSIGVSFLL